MVGGAVGCAPHLSYELVMHSPDDSRLALEDMFVGQTFVSGTHQMDAEQIVAFASQYDPQPFHLSDVGAKRSLFGSLAASGWHTMAISMRLMVESIPFADGLIGASTEVSWPKPTRPESCLKVFSKIVEIRPSRSKPGMAIVTVRAETRDRDDSVLQIFVAQIPVFARQGRGD